MDWRVTEERGDDDFKAVQKGLGDFNAAAGLEGAAVPFNVYLHEDGQIVGGLCGETAEDRLWVGQVWVEERRRGEGLGKAIMDEAERQARERGCTRVFLDTFEVQAPGFYTKLGFEIVSDEYEVEGIGPHVRMRRGL